MMLTTAQEETTSAASPEVGTARVEAFSDSAMAVIITIMAFELRPPQGFTLEAMRDQYLHALPTAAYGVVALAAGFAYSILVRTLIKANGSDSRVARAVGSDTKGYMSLVLYGAAVVLAFVNPWISYALYVSVALMWFVPDPRFTRR